jgi:hypothetical protein
MSDNVRDLAVRAFLVLFVGVQMIPQYGPFVVPHGSAFHTAEIRTVSYGWPIVLWRVEERRITVGVSPNAQ